MSDRRIGRFTISEKLLREAISTGHGQNLFVGMVPLDIQRNWMTSEATYVAWHADFAPVPDGQIIPEYVAVFQPGKTTPTWEPKP